MSARPSPAAKPIRIVLVDDTVDVREMLSLMLGTVSGFEVVGEADDGAEAVRVAIQLKPDLIVLDLSMPVMDGFEALPHLRAGCPGAKIIIFSGFAASDLEKQARAGGADAYVTKGARRQQIVEAIEKVVGI